MNLIAFKINKFRSIEETKWIDINDITNIIGVNESGKSNILLALWKFNPVNDGLIDLITDLPRDEYAKSHDDCADIAFVNTRWDISTDTDLIKKYNPIVHLYLSAKYHPWKFIDTMMVVMNYHFLIC